MKESNDEKNDTEIANIICAELFKRISKVNFRLHKCPDSYLFKLSAGHPVLVLVLVCECVCGSRNAKSEFYRKMVVKLLLK